MTDFLSGMGRHVEDRMAESDQLFALRCVKLVCKFHGIEPEVSAEELGFGWFHEQFSNYPVFLEARRVKFDWADIVERVSKTEPWKEMVDLLQTCGRRSSAHGLPVVGIITPSRKLGLWVCHNAEFLEQVPGHPRVRHQARTKEWGIVFDPLQGFLESVKQLGWTP